MTESFASVRAHSGSRGPVVAFAGPSAHAKHITDWLRGSSRPIYVVPPARLGDMWRAGAHEPISAMLLIDGLYERVPAVWHKEILALLDRGIPVYGAASMGALRAAELHTLGMVGVGQVFEWLVSGYIDADDEVALLHAPAGSGWRPLNVPLVTIRATMAAAVRAGAAGDEEAMAIVNTACERFYPERQWDSLLCAASPALAAWVQANIVDVKALDCRELCTTVVNDLRHHLDPVDRGSADRRRLVRTTWWDRFIAHAAQTDRDSKGVPS